MDRAFLRQFAHRDWSAVAASKTRFWLERKAQQPAAEVLEVAERMRRHARQMRPDWPTPQQRLDDIRVHQRVGEALRAVVHRSR